MAASAGMISAGLLPSVMRKRTTVEPVMARFSEASQRQPETADRGFQPLHRDIAGDLEHHLVLDEAGLGGRRNVDDPPVEADRQLLLLPLLRTGRSQGLLLRRQSDAA